MLKTISVSGAVVIAVLCSGCDVSTPNSTTTPASSAAAAPAATSSGALTNDAAPSSTDDSTPKWDVSSNVDRMSNAQKWFATSPTVSSMDPMSAPYTDTQAWMAVGCDNKSEWAYVGFSQQPNLTNTDIHQGYSSISTPIKWDSKTDNVTLIQNWGDKFLHFDSDKEATKQITHHKSVILELPWYGSGSVYFQFPLDGAEEAVSTIRSKCGIGQTTSASKSHKHQSLSSQ